MSKFQEICAAYKISRDNYHAYRDRSMDFAVRLGQGYIRYLGISSENYKWVPATDTSTEKEGFTIPGSMHLNDDTYWHLGLKIKIFTAPNVFPQQELLIIFKFKEKKEKVFEVMIDNIDKKYEIETCSDASFTVFFNHLQKVILAMYQDGLDNFLASQQEDRKIGFIP